MEENKWLEMLLTEISKDETIQGFIKAGNILLENWKKEENKEQEIEKIIPLTLQNLLDADERIIMIKKIIGYMYDVNIEFKDVYLQLLKSTWGELPIEKQESLWEKLTNNQENAIILSRIFTTSKLELQEKKKDEIWEKIKDNEYAVEKVWENLDEKEQLKRWDEFINFFNRDEEYLDGIWENTKEKVKQEKYDEIIRTIEPGSLLKSIWKDATKEQQLKSKDFVLSNERMKEMATNNPFGLKDMLANSTPEVKKEKVKYVLQLLIDKEDFYSFRETWKLLDEESVKENKELYINLLEKETSQERYYGATEYDKSYEIWENFSKEIQDDFWNEVFDTIKQNKFSIIGFLSGTNKELLLKNAEEILNLYGKDKEYREAFYKAVNDELKEKYFEIFLETVKTANINIREMWESTGDDLQTKKWDEVMANLPKGIDFAKYSIWGSTNLKLQREKWNEIVQDGLTVEIWRTTQPELQEEKIESLLDERKKDFNSVIKLWSGLAENVQANHMDIWDSMIEETSKNYEKLGEIWKETKETIQRKKWTDIMHLIELDTNTTEMILLNTNEKVLVDNFKDIIKLIENDNKLLGDIWKKCGCKQYKVFDEMIQFANKDAKKLSIVWKNTRK
jgi:uncharacterized protein YndB with AHSA1/START domain